jgi:UDP:flavonoid glycosyltransferase YjiC (YdhE family)
MSKILVVPLPEPGHIFPTLRVTRHLCDCGHDVTYLTAPHFKSLIQAAGARLEPLLSSDEGERSPSGIHIWALLADGDGLRSRPAKLQEILRRIQDQDNFQFVLLDHLLAATYWNEQFDPSRLLLFSTSLPDWNRRGSTHLDLPTIVFCPECFEVPKFRHGYPRLHYVEPSLRPPDDSNSKGDGFVDDRPLILTAFGTQSIKDRRLNATYKLISELAHRLPQFKFLLAAPDAAHYDSASSVTFPTNMVVAEQLPQRFLLQRAAAFITHGGLGSVKEAIAAAVPMIVLPSMNDQPYNAMRVRFHGLGGALFKENRNIDDLERLVTDAVEGKFKSSLLRMKEHFLALERAAISHMLIDSHLATVENSSTPGCEDALHAATLLPNE